MAEAVAAIVVTHDIDAIVYVEVKQVCVVLNLLGVHGVRTAQDHRWLSRLWFILRLLSSWDPVAVDSLVVIRAKEDGLSLRVTKFHLCP